MRRGPESGGFTLLELLIVVGIILIIATIAIPSILRSRQTANENSAVANLRTVSNAEALYLSASGGSYGTFSQMVDTQLLDDRFTSTGFSGYSYTITATQFEFTVIATPLTSTTGRYEFYMAVDGVIRYSTSASLAPAGKAGGPVS
jgi:prepilin-type N-terminal cleavage/methylation domain-containing protein